MVQDALNELAALGALGGDHDSRRGGLSLGVGSGRKRRGSKGK